MYAVIETGGKQYRVEVGTVLAVERIDAEPGQQLHLDRVLLVADGNDAAIGRPVVDGARVTASVVRQERADKVVVFKYRPKARHRVKHGHRQDQTLLRIEDIVHGARSAAVLAEAARAEEERRAADLAAAAERRAAADRELAERLAAPPAQPTGSEGDSAPAAGKPLRAKAAAKTARTVVGSEAPAAESSAKAAKPKTQARGPETKSRGGGSSRKKTAKDG
jgi:large subunit ribosomal protein L21